MSDFQLPPIVEQYYDFCRWLVPKISKFPRDQRHILGSRIENLALQILENLISAAMQSGTQKFTILQTTSIQLEQVRYLLRMAKDTMLINEKSHQYACRLLANIGKSLGGWLKSLKTEN